MVNSGARGFYNGEYFPAPTGMHKGTETGSPNWIEFKEPLIDACCRPMYDGLTRGS